MMRKVFFVGYLAITILSTSAFSTPNKKSSKKDKLPMEMCEALATFVYMCRHDKFDCKDALQLKKEITDDEVLGEQLSKICYYACTTERTGIDKEEFNKTLRDFFKKNCF